MSEVILKIEVTEVNDETILSLLDFGSISESNGQIFLTTDTNYIEEIEKLKNILKVSKTNRKVK